MCVKKSNQNWPKPTDENKHYSNKREAIGMLMPADFKVKPNERKAAFVVRPRFILVWVVAYAKDMGGFRLEQASGRMIASSPAQEKCQIKKLEHKIATQCRVWGDITLPLLYRSGNVPRLQYKFRKRCDDFQFVHVLASRNRAPLSILTVEAAALPDIPHFGVSRG